MQTDIKSLTRRRVLQSSAALAAGSMTGCSQIPFEDGSDHPEVFDLHAHTFNASDLPLYGFLVKVVMRKRSSTNGICINGQDVPKSKALAWFLSRVLKGLAPSAKTELKNITSGHWFSKTNEKSLLDEDAQDMMRFQDRLSEVLFLLVSKDADLPQGPLGADEMEIIESEIPELIDLIEREISDIKEETFKFQDESEDKTVLTHQTDDAAQLLMFGRSGGSIKSARRRKRGLVSRYLHWAFLLTRRRQRILKYYRDAYHSGRSGVYALSPALIDYDYWLNDKPERGSSIPQQIELMNLTVEKEKAIKLLPYVPFDPLRQVVETIKAGTCLSSPGSSGSSSSLEWAQSAIEDGNFTGVKIYPPMGFAPYGNSHLTFPKNIRDLVEPTCGAGTTGAKLDQAMALFFTWSSRSDIPVLAHAGRSNGPSDEVEDRAGPDHWRKALENFPTLRVTFAHMGDVEKFANDPMNTWAWEFGKLMEDFPDAALYLDLSYLSELLMETDACRNLVKGFFVSLKQFTTRFDSNVERLTFGTDWIMLGQENSYQNYVTLFRDALSNSGFGAHIDNIMRKNAQRFLKQPVS